MSLEVMIDIDKNSKYKKSQFAPVIIILCCLILGGLIMLYSTTSYDHGIYFIIRQIIYIILGLVICFIIRSIDYNRLLPYTGIFLGSCLCMLFYIAFSRFLIQSNIVSSMPFVASVKGAYRWIKFSLISIQPSEFAKIALVLYLAAYSQRMFLHRKKFFAGFLIPLIIGGMVCLAIFLGKNLSVTIVCGIVTIGMVCFAGCKKKWLVLCVVLGSAVLFGDYVLKTEIIMAPYRMRRIDNWLEPEKNALGDGLQLWRSQIALGSGGVSGRGYTNSIMKNKFLPESHTDFILSVTGEEFGMIGILLILILYQILVFVGLKIAYQSTDLFGAYLAIGITISIYLHAMINLSVMSGLFPTTGLTAPFISYGGSSMLANLIGVGLLLSVDNKNTKNNRELEVEHENSN